jgi:hypothetical protein
MTPDADMLAVAEKLARFIEGNGRHLPDDLFADGDIAIVENFAPYLFSGPDAVTRWAQEMRTHLAELSALRHRFGDVFDFSRTGDDVYFSLITTWNGFARATPFSETGGWALVLTRQAAGWRLRGYGWAVIASTSVDTE